MSPSTLTRPDPRELDYRDGLNPFLLPQFSPELRPQDFAILQSELYVALRLAANYELRLEAIPDQRNATVIARGSYESRFYLPHGSFLYAFSAASPQAAGFSFQVSDLGAGGVNLFASPITSANATGGTVNGVTNRLVLLQRPRAIVAPGLISAAVVNRAAAANALQLVLWFVQPTQNPGPLEPENQFNAILRAEIERFRPSRIVSITSGGAPVYGTGPEPPPLGVNPWDAMPASGRPFVEENIAAVPAPGTNDFTVVSFVVPSGFTAALKRHRHRYIGPGFVDGEGDLIWRITVDGAAVPGFDNMTTTAGGDTYENIDGAIIADSGQTVRYTVSVDAGAVLGDSVLCGLRGYYYPQR